MKRWPREDRLQPRLRGGGDAEKRRQRRKWATLLGGAHLFWINALILAGIVVLPYYVLR
jgi:hypothetical protein